MPDPYLIRRGDGRVEEICCHGIGHTVAIDRVPYLRPYSEAKDRDKQAWWSHGCDGCCKNMRRLHD